MFDPKEKELKRQSETLKETQQLIDKNAKQISILIDCTKESQNSATKQFYASLILSISAIIISFLTLLVSCLQFFYK